MRETTSMALQFFDEAIEYLKLRNKRTPATAQFHLFEISRESPLSHISKGVSYIEKLYVENKLLSYLLYFYVSSFYLKNLIVYEIELLR